MSIRAVENVIRDVRAIVKEWDCAGETEWREDHTRYAVIDAIIRALGSDRGMYRYYGLVRHMAFWHLFGTKPIGKRVLLLPEPRPGPPTEPKIICHPEAGNTKYIPLSGERARVRVIPPPPKSCPSIDKLRMILRRAQDVRERPNSAGFGLW